jgi:Fe-S-cluster-containing dehydrogenase component
MRKGVKLNNVILVATSCRHCEDPTCMIDCRTGAISRDFTGEIFIRDACIGCGKCARKCPYGNISIVTLSDTDEANNYHRRFFAGWSRKKGNGTNGADGEMPSSNNKTKGKKKSRKLNAICAGNILS